MQRLHQNLTQDYNQNLHLIKERFAPQLCYDFIERHVKIMGERAYILALNGLADTNQLVELLSQLQDASFMGNTRYPGKGDYIQFGNFIKEKFSFVELNEESDLDKIEKMVLSGVALMLLDGYDKGLLLDVRSYPSRPPSEPDMEKVLRGSKDGFVENLLNNVVMIRRRIRTSKLTFERMDVGTESKTDVVMAYVKGKAEDKLTEEIRRKVTEIEAPDLTMGIRSLQELIMPKKWYHPMPNAQFTERPDVAASYLEEGYVLLMVDNTPSVMVLPCNFFQFTQSPEDFYKSPLIGNYIRWIRLVCLFLSLLIMPLFLLFTIHIPLPGMWSLTAGESVQPIRMFILALIVEFALDLFRYSIAHTSDRFAGALSIVGGLLIGEMAIELKWANPQLLFYGAITLMASLTLASLELSEAVRMYRLVLILLTGPGGVPGLVVGLILVFISIAKTPMLGKQSYLWPLIPFRWKSLRKLLFRFPTNRNL